MIAADSAGLNPTVSMDERGCTIPLDAVCGKKKAGRGAVWGAVSLSRRSKGWRSGIVGRVFLSPLPCAAGGRWRMGALFPGRRRGSGASVGAWVDKRLLIGSVFESEVIDCVWDGAA